MAIPLVGPDGRRYEIDDPAKVEQAKALGYRVATEEAPQTLGEAAEGLGRDVVDVAETGLEGAVQGLTGGLYGAALARKQGDQESPENYAERRANVEDFKARREENPIASGVGELAGMLVSPINKLGAAVRGGVAATTAIGRVGSAALGEGAEGLLYGAGNTLSEVALGDQDLTGEKLLAGIGLGGALGLAGGGLGAGLVEGFKAIVPRAAKALTGSFDSLEDFATNRALKAAGAAKSDLAYLGPDKAKEVGQMLLERGHLGKGAEAPNAEGVLRSVAAEKDVVGKQIGKVFDDAHAAGLQPSYSGVLKRLDDFEAGLSPLERKEVAGTLRSTRAAVLEYGGRPITDPRSGFKALNELKQNLQAKAKYSKNLSPDQEFGGELKKKLAQVVREELDTQLVPQLGAATGKAFTDANHLYGLLSGAERIAKHGADKLGGNASFGLRDLGVGLGVLNAFDPVTGVISAVANKVMRERGQGVIARLADQISKSPRMQLTATSFGQQLPTAAPNLGEYAPVLLQAYAHSPAQGLATHMTLAHTDPGYAAAAQKAGFLPETPEENELATKKAGTLGAVAFALDKQNTKIREGLEAALKGARSGAASSVMKKQDFGTKRMRRDSRESFQKRVDEIRELAANPDALIERVAGNAEGVAEMAPGVVGAMTRSAYAAVQFLAQQSQEPPKAGPLAAAWVPTNAEIDAFSRVLETVEDPMSVLKHAGAGTLTEDQVHALNTVYPLLGRQIADQALELLTSNPKSVPYSSRLTFSMLTGIDVDGTLSPEAVARNQAAIRGTNSKSNGAPQPPGERKTKLTLASRTALPNQQREMNDGGDS